MLKICRLGFCRLNIVLKVYLVDRRLCVYIVFVEYLKRILLLWSDNDDVLFILYVKFYNVVFKDILLCWIRYIMI